MNLRATVLFLMIILLALPYGQSKQKRISVLPFKGWQGNDNRKAKEYRESLTDKILTRIVQSHRFVVVDRDNLNKIIKEQKLQTSSGLIDQSTAVEIGRLIGIDRFILGNFNRNSVQYHPATYYKDSNGQQKKATDPYYTSEISVTMKLLDVETGAYLEAAEAKGHSRGKNQNEAYLNTLEVVADNILIAFEEYFKIEAFISDVNQSSVYIDAGRNLGVENGMSFSVYSVNSRDSDYFKVGVSDNVVGQFKVVSTESHSSMGKLFGDFSRVKKGDLVRESKKNIKVEARVMEKKLNKVLINAGSDLGLSVGSTFSVSGKTKEMIDPITGEVYGRETKDIGKIYVYELGPGFARGKIISGRYKIKEGMKLKEIDDLIPQTGINIAFGEKALQVDRKDDLNITEQVSFFQLSYFINDLTYKLLVNGNIDFYSKEDDYSGSGIDVSVSKGFYLLPELISVYMGIGAGFSGFSQDIHIDALRALQPEDEPNTNDTDVSDNSAYLTANLMGKIDVGRFALFANVASYTMKYDTWSYTYREPDDGDEETYESLETREIPAEHVDELKYQSVGIPLSFNFGFTYKF